MLIKSEGIRFQQSSRRAEKVIEVEMASLHFCDWAFDFANPDYQCLLSVETSKSAATTTTAGRKAISVRVTILSPDHRDYANVNVSVDCMLEE
jgi:hypothetical protein